MTPPVVLAWCAFAADDSTMADPKNLDDLRAALLALHRELVEEERRAYEKTHGRQTGADFLQTLIADPAFAWLAPLTTLIVRLDELDAEENPDAERSASSKAARALLVEQQSEFRRRSAELVQRSPDVAFAYAAARRAALGG
jgi:hypothetical protein